MISTAVNLPSENALRQLKHFNYISRLTVPTVSTVLEHQHFSPNKKLCHSDTLTKKKTLTNSTITMCATTACEVAFIYLQDLV